MSIGLRASGNLSYYLFSCHSAVLAEAVVRKIHLIFIFIHDTRRQHQQKIHICI